MENGTRGGAQREPPQLNRQFRLEWLLFGLAMLILGGYIGQVVYADYNYAEAEEKDRLLAQAHVVNQNLGRELIAVDRMLASIRDDLPLLKSQVNSTLLINGRLQAMCDAMPGVRTIVLLDADGTASYSNRKELIGGNYRQRALFEVIRRDPDPAGLYVSPPFKTPLGVYATSVGKVTLDDRRAISAIIWAVLDPEYFETLLNSVRYVPDVISTLIHGDGKVVFSLPGPNGDAGVDLATPGSIFARHMQSGLPVSLVSGAGTTSGDARLQVLQTIRPPALRLDKPLVVSISRDRTALFAPWRKEVYRHGGLFALLLLSTATGLILFQRRRRAFGRIAAALEEERKQAQEALARESKRNQAFLRNASDGVHILDADGNVLEASDSFCDMLGYARKELIGANVSLWDAQWSPPELRQKIAEQIAAPGRSILETRHRRRDGTMLDVEITGQGLELDGKPVLFNSARDISERRRLEEVHLQAQKLESLGTLTGGIAHDFNNILTAIQGNAHLAAEDVGPDHAAAESLHEIRKASVRASELVRRIMAFGRPRELQREVADLAEVVGEVLKLLRSTLPAAISLEMQFDENTPLVLADAGQVHEAIVNLTTNAAYAIGPRAGSIAYRLQTVQVAEALARSIPGFEQGRYVRLTVTDSGCGMNAATLERIFDAFYTTKPVGEGTGLGLSMVHGIMKSHGGAVTAESTPGKGSSFALYFPVASAEATGESAGAPAHRQPGAGQRLLYVDDEEALVFLAGRALSRLGHSVSGFADPEAALEAFRADPQAFDVVVTDLSMPHMSGIDLAREVLALRPGMPVLMTTGYIRAEDHDAARAIGVRKLILKPVAMDELGRELDRLLRGDDPNTRRPA